MVSRRVDPDVDRLWQEFHRYVNQSSAQLRAFLFTEASNEDGAFPIAPDQDASQPGQQILSILAKRKVDLTDDDIDAMDSVVAQIRELLDRRPPDGTSDHDWRRALMSLGHDPLQEPPGAE